jgi:hypothetical protein
MQTTLFPSHSTLNHQEFLMNNSQMQSKNAQDIVSSSLNEQNPITKYYNFCPAILEIIKQANEGPSKDEGTPKDPSIVSNPQSNLNALPINENINNLLLLNNSDFPNLISEFCPAILEIIKQANEGPSKDEGTPKDPSIVSNPQSNLNALPINENINNLLLLNNSDFPNLISENSLISEISPLSTTPKKIIKKLPLNEKKINRNFAIQVINYFDLEIKENRYTSPFEHLCCKVQIEFDKADKKKITNRFGYYKKLERKLDISERNTCLKVVKQWIEKKQEPDWIRFLKIIYPNYLNSTLTINSTLLESIFFDTTKG